MGGRHRSGRYIPILAGLALAACARQAPPVAVAKAPVEATASVDRAVATTGDVLTYSLTVDRDAAIALTVPEVGATIAGFRIVDVGRDKPRTAAGRVVERRWYQLRADLVGSYILPPVEIAWDQPGPHNPGQGRQTARTAEIFVEVKSVLPKDGEAGDIRDVKPLRRLPWRLPPWAWALGGAALLALAGYVLWRRFRRRSIAEVPPLPAHEIAFQALGLLRQTDFADPVALRRYYFAVSEVIRAYVERRFGLNATDLTTEEILRRLAEIPTLPGVESERLRRFLLATDDVKFAAHVPSEREIHQTYEDALSFVESTRPAPEPLPGTIAGAPEGAGALAA